MEWIVGIGLVLVLFYLHSIERKLGMIGGEVIEMHEKLGERSRYHPSVRAVREPGTDALGGLLAIGKTLERIEELLAGRS